MVQHLFVDTSPRTPHLCIYDVLPTTPSCELPDDGLRMKQQDRGGVIRVVQDGTVAPLHGAIRYKGHSIIVADAAAMPREVKFACLGVSW